MAICGAHLRFLFRLANRGTAPALVRDVLAYATLSFGPGTREDDEPTPRSFPDKKDYLRQIRPPWGIVRVRSDETSTKTEVFGTTVIMPSEKSRIFESLVPYPPLDTSGLAINPESVTELHELTGNGRVRPWLFAHVRYQAPFGAGYITNYCAHGFGDNGAMDYNEPPYTERT